MGDFHQMVIDYIGKLVGRDAVRFDQDLVVKTLGRESDIAAQFIMDDYFPGKRHLLADDKFLSGPDLLRYFSLV